MPAADLRELLHATHVAPAQASWPKQLQKEVA
jgi:hypothetical protein